MNLLSNEDTGLTGGGHLKRRSYLCQAVGCGKLSGTTTAAVLPAATSPAVPSGRGAVVQVCVWRWPTLAKAATLTGHTTRVLYLAASPDGQTIVTGAGGAASPRPALFARTPRDRHQVAAAGASSGRGAGVGQTDWDTTAIFQLSVWRFSMQWPWVGACGAGDETLRFWNVFPSAHVGAAAADSSVPSMMRAHIR